MNKRLAIIIPVVLISLFFISQTSLAANYDLSKGIMPDNPLYPVDKTLEKIQLSLFSYDTSEQADIHLGIGSERLGELNYLAERDKADLGSVADLTEDYQNNIQQYSNLITKNPASSELEKISPKLNELKEVQTQVVEKINQKNQSDEVKIIVKSSIKESQEAIVQAVAEVVEGVNVSKTKEAADSSTTSPKQKKQQQTIDGIMVGLNKTIDEINLKTAELSQEIKADEESLKNKKKAETDSTVVTNEVVATDLVPAVKTVENSGTKVDAVTENKVEKAQPKTTSTPPTENVTVEPEAVEWYYSVSCDYVSKTSEDPLCGDDMIPVSTLPPDHSFFTKYTVTAEGKYVQTVDQFIESLELAEEEAKNSSLAPVVTEPELAVPTAPTEVPATTPIAPVEF